MPDLNPGLRLRGRRGECERLNRLLQGVGASRSQVLVLRGEAGVGKSALLDYLTTEASDCHVLRAAGIQSEMEFPFAGLHQLCAPILDGRQQLPAPQRDALGTAFGLSAGDTPNRFLVGLAVLNLLASNGEKQPLICLIDDAQWLDRSSAQVLAFVARRLLAEPVAMVFAVREPAELPELEGLPRMDVRCLGERDARALLESVIPGRLDERVRDRIVAETHGNPLALLELPRGLSVAELAGGFAAPDAAALTSRIEQSFDRQFRALPPDTQRLLLLASAEPVGDVPLLWRAAALLGIGPDAATPAEEARLIELASRVCFRHPLMRSSAYRAASISQRQEVHRALADATDPTVDPDRRAWHRAQAATGPDEAVAGELELSAGRARARGGVAAAAAFLARASHLSPDPEQRTARALAAAQAKFEAGAPDAALELLAAAEIGPLDELQRARLACMRAEIAFARKRSSDSPRILLDAAKRLEPLDHRAARSVYLEALGAAIFAGRLSQPSVKEVAELVQAAPRKPEAPTPADLLMDGVATRLTTGYVAAVEPLRQALLTFRTEAARSERIAIRWLWSACPVAPEPLAAELWDDEAWHELATRAVRLAREAGALTTLPLALTYRAGVHVYAGEFAAAAALIEEADGITAATGNAPLRYTALILTAWRGNESSALRMIETCARNAAASGDGRALGLVDHVRAVLHNGLGRYQTALAAAQRACEHEDLSFYGWSLVELIEAAARTGAADAAAAALREFELQASAAGSSWALGMLARSSALVSEGEAADSLYQQAIERLGHCRAVVHLARAHLVYGEWLRRENRRVQAREQLRTAHQMLSNIGAEAFAERARVELLATGETVRKRSADSGEQFTAQEAQVARLAAEGLTNPEIGTQLFISPRTAEYHLRKVFSKLGITSRRELRSTLPKVPSLTV